MKKTIDQAIGGLDRAMDGAIQQLDKAVGEPSDPDVIFYNTMNDTDFMALATRYGMPQVQDFIKEMEMRRLKNA